MKIRFNFDERNVKLGLENQFTLQEFLDTTVVKILMLKGEKGDTVSAQWGTITGNLSNQTDLNTALEGKADTTDIPDVSNFITKDVNNLTNYTKTSDLSDVATSGDYDDLINTPTKVSDFTNDSGFIDKEVNNLSNYPLSSSLSEVATSGDFEDLTNKPTIPSKTSDLTNDNGFINNTVNDLTNYTKTSDLSEVATSGDYDDLTNTPTVLEPFVLMDTDTAISVGTEIALNDDYSNYKYIDVYSSLWSSTFINFTRICTDWKYIEINMVNATNNGATEHAVAVGELTGAKLKINRFSGFSISSSQAISNLTASPRIRKIIGYK